MNEREKARLCCGLLLMGIPGCLLTLGCGDGSEEPSVSSNSNWFVACESSSECLEGSVCKCGACSMECLSDEGCESLEGAVCSLQDAAATLSQCASTQAGSGLCLPGCSPGSCSSEQSCIDGACVHTAIPESEFCRPVATADLPDRTAEEELFAMIQQARVTGTLPCMVTPASAPPLRLVGALVCSARVKALDQEESGVSSSVDSLGRGASERLALAGFEGSDWNEDNFSGIGSVSDAYDGVVLDPDDCPDFGDPLTTSLGIGVVGDNYVVIVGRD